MNRLYCCITLLLLLTPGKGLASLFEKGEDIYINHCAACHKIGQVLIGPDLSGITSRQPENWLIPFIQNSQAVIRSGDAYAIGLFNEYKQVIMPENQLTVDEVKIVLFYIDSAGRSAGFSLPEPVYKTSTSIKPGKQPYGFWTVVSPAALIFILVIAFFLTWVVAINIYNKRRPKPIHMYNRINRVILFYSGVLLYYTPRSFFFVSLLLLMIILGITISAKRSDRFPPLPTQVVEFSHAVHYDTFAIQCVFCHGNSRNNIQAGLPGIQNCMNCHTYITEGKKYGKKEIAKLAAFSKAGKEIAWGTGYRYNDFVHFSHALHVSSAKIGCLDCHTDTRMIEIEKPGVSMKWCIDCHKTRKPDLENKYYRKSIDSTGRSAFPEIALIDNNDCSLCHY